MRLWARDSNPNAMSVEGERSEPVMHRERSFRTRLQGIASAVAMAVLGIGILTWYYSGALGRSAHLRAVAQKTTQGKLQGDAPLPPIGHIDPPPPSVEAAATLVVPLPPPSSPPVSATTPVTASVLSTSVAPLPLFPSTPAAYAPPVPKTPQQLALERRLGGEVFDRGGQGPTVASVATVDTGSAAPKPAPAAAQGSSSLLAASASAAVVQARLLPDRHFLLPKGAFIDCTLETAIDSTLPGVTTCITATDTFGADGTVVLLERGTKLIGETRGQVLQGAARVGVIWSEARTPTGVVVPLESPATDELGRSGLPGTVNRHFWDRFGAAILISTLDAAVQAAVQSTSRGGATVVYNPGSSEAIGTEALKSTVAIAPTVVKTQGDRVQAVVARDIDFRAVYELRLLPAR